MDKSHLIVAIISFILGGIASYLLKKHVLPKRQLIYSWAFALRRHGRLGRPSKADLVLDRKGYLLGYSFEKKAALWVMYKITHGSVNIDMERAEAFTIDPDVPEKHRALPSDYTNSGFDKGHLAPSAAIDFTKKSNDETFYMSNVLPQNPLLNRQAWKSLEQQERAWLKTKGQLFVVVGAIFSERSKRLNGIAIPKAFYRVVYSPNHVKAIGFIMPNEPIKAADMWKYAVPVSEVEKESGHTFLHKLSRRRRRVKEKVDLAWWQTK